MKNLKNILNLSIALLLIAIAGCSGSSGSSSSLDNFAKCLSGNNVKMYGAFWCTHCQNQKEMFSSSAQYINYIECSTPDGQSQTQACIDAGIKAYPTWEFQDTSRIEGEISLQQLSQKSGCVVEQNQKV